MASVQSAQVDVLTQCFAGLRSKSHEQRLEAAIRLRRYVAATTAEMTPDAASKLWDDNINRKLFDLMHSQNTTDNYGGLLAIDHLLEITSGETIESKVNLFRFYNYVKHLFPHHDVNLMLVASKTLGQIAHIGGASFGDRFMDFEVPAAIELMHPDKQESPRYAGVLILKELARNSPGYFHAHISLVFDNILIPLRDQRVIVREGAAELLAACLEIVTQRERQARNTYLTKILQDAQGGLRLPQAEVIHGSLLTYRELLLHAGMFMKDSYMDTAEKILRFRSHRDHLVRKQVIAMIPSLAAYDTQTFKENYLVKAMSHLLTQLEKPHERHFAFIAIGHTATAIGADIKTFLESIMAQIKIGLQSRGKKNTISEEPIFQCIGMLAAAVGPHLTKYLHDQYDLMFSAGLSEPLVQALAAIVHSIPPVLGTIQEKLLNQLSLILSGQPFYKPLGAPSALPPDTSSSSKELGAQGATVEKNPEIIALALNTLWSFDFSGQLLNEFVQTNAMPYLEDDNSNVRRAAALTCCRLFQRDPITWQTSSHATEIVNNVLDKLLTAGIADPDSSIRHTVLSSLHERFDRHLAQSENVRSLFMALNDEEQENRVAAVSLIGRLAKHNPAYVVPSLRKALIQLLTELQYTSVLRNREECTRLLSLLITATQRLIKPYAIPILRVLLQKANDSNPTVASHVLNCIGELSCVAGEDQETFNYVPEIMTVLMNKLADPNLTERDAALHTLGQVCSSTGYVIQPLTDYPQLLGLLGKILKTETSQNIRREVVKVLGILGAIDPYTRKQGSPMDDLTNDTTITAVNQVPLNQKDALTSDDYFQNVVIKALLDILKDQSLASHHHMAIEAVMSIFKTQGLKCAAFLPQIVPAFTTVTRNSAPRLQEFHLQQLTILVGIIKQHIRNYMPTVFNLITEIWDNVALQLPLVSLIEALSKALSAEFKPFLPTVIPLVLKVFDGELNDKRVNTQIKIFDAFQTFGANIEEYLHLVIPLIVRAYDRLDGTTPLRKKAIQTIDVLSKRVNFSDHASRIMHPLVRVLENSNHELRQAAMDTMCSLCIQFGADFAIFVTNINKVLVRHRIQHLKYESLINKLLSGEQLPQEPSVLEILSLENSKNAEFPTPAAEAAKLTVNQQHLKSAWDTSQTSTKEDWTDWIHRLTVELMKESPSHGLRACMSLVDIHGPLARELFNAAFLSCWGELYDQYQEDLVRAIETALTSQTAPSDLIHRLLSLAEFMEHEEKPLPIEPGILGECALKNLAYAKAMHYKETEYFSEASPSTIEALISINTRLQQQDAAWGTLVMAHERYDVSKQEEWFERLGRWQEALDAYDRRIEENTMTPDVQIGRMKCLHALGEWDSLATQVDEVWQNATNENRREIAPIAAAAAWSLNDWDSMEEYIATMRPDSSDRYFYRAILSVHQNQFQKALLHIAKSRDLLDPELSSFVGEGYGRSYSVMVRAQMLSELEEIISYKRLADQPERQQTMRKTWIKRLQGCQKEVEVWQRILQVRTLVLNPEDDPIMWIKFANLCRKSDRMALAGKTINTLLAPHENVRSSLRDHRLKAPPNVVYAHLKFMWANGAKESSLTYLRQFSSNLSRDLQAPDDTHTHPWIARERKNQLSKLLARCYFKQGQWQIQAQSTEGWVATDANTIINCYVMATQHDPDWYKAWHTWALANLDVITYLEGQPENRFADSPPDNLAKHVVQAIEGLFRSVSLRSTDTLQDTLRILTLWFKFGGHSEVGHVIGSGFNKVGVDNWLEVIPQIIARIQTPHTTIRRHIQTVLIAIGRAHPQAMIYPLTVASKSSSKIRSDGALEIIAHLRERHPVIVEQAIMISAEIIRVAILWNEMWHEGLEEASRIFFTEKNPEGMIAALEPLHELMENPGPTTAREISFIQTFGKDLRSARDACHRYRRFGETSDLDKAWDIYYVVFKKIEKQLPQLQTLDLQYVSPKLLEAKDLDLAVPGTYQSGREPVYISSFSPRLTVIASKQRPRRLALRGSDGRDYQYLLKGHEDLRQDERVMQLFSLVNNLLTVDTSSYMRRLQIQRFPVIPLAPNAGLLGWVQGSDTFHVLVRDYRESRKILLNIEYRLMLQMAPDYENLTLLQKVEVFEYALQNTHGQDLYRVLWLKSRDSEHWLERRTTYTRSLAVNSMVGHVLGLGDRHPSNLLLERETGKVVHIDFGDCFEVAMLREKFPEKVPFRLTRMLTHAMEVSGIEGSFRNTCEISMQVLRDNKNSLMAVLEAFVYDPLINWRLMQPDGRGPEAGSDQTELTQFTHAAAYAQGPARKLKADENDIFGGTMGGVRGLQEVRNERALFVYNRVQNKLTGRDFDPAVTLSVTDQVDKLIKQATSLENLCQLFSGW
ncbi:atypical/PIKK/FRAP protein kinase [Cylindrobasidium torrendii FP15055 ss-10]|uniref:Serine/threonine-protein kinase TOR n=1 Tax=Cylindrobasidium torrendii FP15055 ss-10 TaxID=1314674 RepID=A0A0D7BSQ3_9AGAR|nr:atypical/PIKK/FRAP protein kinase [Cylindrobasidium torrendii FP15055 ss-10]